MCVCTTKGVRDLSARRIDDVEKITGGRSVSRDYKLRVDRRSSERSVRFARNRKRIENCIYSYLLVGNISRAESVSILGLLSASRYLCRLSKIHSAATSIPSILLSLSLLFSLSSLALTDTFPFISFEGTSPAEITRGARGAPTRGVKGRDRRSFRFVLYVTRHAYSGK